MQLQNPQATTTPIKPMLNGQKQGITPATPTALATGLQAMENAPAQNKAGYTPTSSAMSAWTGPTSTPTPTNDVMPPATAQTTLQQTPGGQYGTINENRYGNNSHLRGDYRSPGSGGSSTGFTSPLQNPNATAHQSNFGPVDTGVDEFRQFGDQYYNHTMDRLNPQMDRREGQVRQSLIDRGLQPGTEAFNAELSLMNQSNNDMMSSAALGAEQLGLQAQNQYFGQESQNNQFGLAQNQQNYGQQFGYDQLANALRQSQIGANASTASARASANASMHNAGLQHSLGMNNLNETGRQFDVNNIYNTNGQNQQFMLGLGSLYNNMQNTGINQFNSQQGANNQWFNQTGALTANAPGVIFNPNQNYVGNQINANGQHMGAIGADSGMGAGLASGLIGMFSDIRLKENVELVDSIDGLDVYEFDYIDKSIGSERYRGVMAQDVIKSKPEAIKWRDGFMTVLYDLLPVNMEVV